MTGDGRPDLITANLSSNDVSVLTAHNDDETPPVTTDDVPTTSRSAPVPVTLTAGASASLAVDMRPTAAARSVAARYPLGVDATVTATATTAGGAPLTASGRLTVLGNATVVLPVRSASSTELSAASKRTLSKLARTVGTAKSVRCAAYTDDSRSASAARTLTVGQARAACRYLQQRGLKAKTAIRGHGSSRPRASNRTAKGRAKNRRLATTTTL